jgi:UDP-N-acetylglucosamine--N-acetylmuramyl-(pentapeptide) pyrophosphoryl-undecaprenol N-acetylglucosamine transferase
VLRARGVSVSFAGSPDRVEARLVPEAGFEFDPFRIVGLPRRPGVAQLRAVLLAGRAPRACGRILTARRPDVVFGGGGYVAGPMVYAAWRKRIPAALAEADAHLGLANRIAAPFARRVFLAYPVAGRTGARYRVVGRPVPERAVTPDEARRHFDFPPRSRSCSYSAAARERRPSTRSRWRASAPMGRLCSTSAGALPGRADRSACGSTTSCSADETPERRWTCDLVLARAGGSVWEVAAAGKPAVLVPSPNVTADHQTKNARYFEQAGGAVVVPEPEIARVPGIVRNLLSDGGRLTAMGQAMRRASKPAAAQEIAEELIALART